MKFKGDRVLFIRFELVLQMCNNVWPANLLEHTKKPEKFGFQIYAAKVTGPTNPHIFLSSGGLTKVPRDMAQSNKQQP